MDSVVERRLAAILAADVVGYSKLVEADEAGTLAAIRRLRAEVVDPLLAKHHGRIVKLMGDGTIAEFGSVVDAVCCAVAVQKETRAAQADVVAERRITFRIGVNLGDVVVEGDDLLGDGVNVAARLEQLCDPGGVLISGTAFDHLRGRLDLPLDDAGEQHVKNISRPVRTYRVRLEGSGQPWRLRARQHIGRLRYAAAILVVLGLAGAGYWWMHPIEKAEAKPSIAVLPFDNMGGDEATGRLADGITEDIITDLARFRELDVIARNSTEAYSGKAVDVRQVGKDLNVGYVMEGSIQREGDQIRVTAQLIATADGSHSWSQRWDRPAGDVFAVQTEIADHVANALGGHGVIFSESRTAAKRKRPADLQAYDLYILSVEADLVGTESSYEKGLAYIDAAIARDPDLARAYIQKGWLLFHLAAFRNNWNETFVELESLARTAISIDPNDATSQAFLALAVGSLGRNAEAAEASARANSVEPRFRRRAELCRRRNAVCRQGARRGCHVRARLPAQSQSARLVLC